MQPTFDFNLIIETANELLPAFIAENKEALTGRTGAYLSLLDSTSTDLPTRGAIVGRAPQDKIVAWMRNAYEKNNRLYRQVVIEGEKYFTSIATQNYATNEYGGGIRTIKGLFASVSGFPPIYDTLFIALVLLKCGYLEEREYQEILEEARLNENTGVTS